MQILDIAPKDIHVMLDMTATEINDLIKALDHAKVDYDGKEEPGMVAATSTLDRFYKLMREVQDGLPKHTAA
jgi:hypothetical protein